MLFRNRSCGTEFVSWIFDFSLVNSKAAKISSRIMLQWIINNLFLFYVVSFILWRKECLWTGAHCLEVIHETWRRLLLVNRHEKGAKLNKAPTQHRIENFGKLSPAIETHRLRGLSVCIFCFSWKTLKQLLMSCLLWCNGTMKTAATKSKTGCW